MIRDLRIKGLPESDEIQESLNNKEYFDVVLKCRVFLESWLSEYIFVLLFPLREMATRANREFVSQRFNDMFFQIQWLRQNDHINKNQHDQLNKMRIFSERVFRKSDVLTIFSLKELLEFASFSIQYCNKFKELTKRQIDRAAIMIE